MEENNWTKMDIYTTTAGAEVLGASLLELGINGFQVQDAQDFEEFLEHKGAYWDYYDESLLKLKDSETIVTVYLSENEQGAETLAAIRIELTRLKELDKENEWGRLVFELSGVREEDWAFGWKKYYHATKVGERLVVCPSWEEYTPQENEVVLKLDPGMAFGTGTHESTRLCMELMQTHFKKNVKVLDLGCGSGILGISAVLLGAQSALGLDIDEVSVRVANENAAINKVNKKCRFIRDTLGNHINGSYGLIFANIVADVIIEYVHHIISNLGNYGIVIVSGIIDTREQDVLEALSAAGLGILERKTEGGWVAFALHRKKI